eukprot:Skav215598  [mRNA]  locus=scaffold666:320674:329733:+ [translate_table: standard]
MKQVVPATPRALRHVESRGVPKLSEVEGRFRPPGRGLRFWTVLRACTGHGDPYRVKAWLDRAKAYNLQVDVRVANSQIHAFAKVADLKSAEKSLLSLIRQGLHPSTESFNAILAACARVESLSSALKWFQRLLDTDLKPDRVTYRTMVSVCARAGNLPLAEEWLGKMLHEWKLDVVSCSSIIGGYASKGDAQNAQKWLERMLLAGLRPSGYAFNPVICAWSYLEASKAEAWIWKAMETGVTPSDVALQRTLASFVKDQDLEGCDRMKALLKQLDQWPRAWALALLAKPHAAAGDFQMVEDLLADLTQCPELEDSELRGCLRALLAAYARSPLNPKDEKACPAALLLALAARVCRLNIGKVTEVATLTPPGEASWAPCWQRARSPGSLAPSLNPLGLWDPALTSTFSASVNDAVLERLLAMIGARSGSFVEIGGAVAIKGWWGPVARGVP